MRRKVAETNSHDDNWRRDLSPEPRSGIGAETAPMHDADVHSKIKGKDGNFLPYMVLGDVREFETQVQNLMQPLAS